MRIYRGQWAKEPLESSLPHEIVDTTGKVRGTFKSKGSATRLLNKLCRKRSPLLIGDPHTWTIRVKGVK